MTTSSFERLLQKDNVSIHLQNIQVLATDMFHKGSLQGPMSLQMDTSKNYDGGLPAKPTFEL